MDIIHLLCNVAGVRTAAFVAVYAQIYFLGSFMFSFFVVPKDVLKTASVDKRQNVCMLQCMVLGVVGR